MARVESHGMDEKIEKKIYLIFNFILSLAVVVVVIDH